MTSTESIKNELNKIKKNQEKSDEILSVGESIESTRLHRKIIDQPGLPSVAIVTTESLQKDLVLRNSTIGFHDASNNSRMGVSAVVAQSLDKVKTYNRSAWSLKRKEAKCQTDEKLELPVANIYIQETGNVNCEDYEQCKSVARAEHLKTH